MSFRRLLASTDLGYVVEVAATPTDGYWAPGGAQIDTTGDNGDGTEPVTCRDDVPIVGAAQRFMRLSVTRAEPASLQGRRSMGRRLSPTRG